jgi:hypothetical protein
VSAKLERETDPVTQAGRDGPELTAHLALCAVALVLILGCAPASIPFNLCMDELLKGQIIPTG